MRLRYDENRKKMEIREREKLKEEAGRKLFIDTRQSFVRIKIALPSAITRAPGILFRSYFLRGPWFSFFRLHLYNRNFLRCNEELHIFNIILIGARAHKGACENTRRDTLYINTRKEDIYTAYTYIRTMEHTR